MGVDLVFYLKWAICDTIIDVTWKSKIISKCEQGEISPVCCFFSNDLFLHNVKTPLIKKEDDYFLVTLIDHAISSFAFRPGP